MAGNAYKLNQNIKTKLKVTSYMRSNCYGAMTELPEPHL